MLRLLMVRHLSTFLETYSDWSMPALDEAKAQVGAGSELSMAEMCFGLDRRRIERRRCNADCLKLLLIVADAGRDCQCGLLY